MYCPSCSASNLDNASYCRSCGVQIGVDPEPTTLSGHALAKFIIGDAFLLPAIILMVMESSIQSNLWILLAIPGLLLYTWAAADLVKASAIKRQRKELAARSAMRELTEPVSNDAAINFAVSVTDRTTRELVRR